MKGKEWIGPVLVVVLLGALVVYAIISQIREHHTQDDPVLVNIMDKLVPLFNGENYTGELEELNDRRILDEIKVYRGNKSYTINKQKVYICLLDENGEYYDENMLTYVILHELSHVICDEIGHTDKFHRIFDAVLDRATTEGLYDPSVPVIRNYCQH
jgi:hypothetical protein